LGDVGVLVFIDQQIAELVLVFLQDLGLVLENGQAVQQEVAEIGGVEAL